MDDDIRFETIITSDYLVFKTLPLYLTSMKNIIKYFIYISFIFLIFALYKANYFSIPRIRSYQNLIVSFFFLFLAFYVTCLSWCALLSKYGFNVRKSDCIESIGLSIFGKYIPGKLWIIVGMASLISEKNKIPFATTSLISVTSQMLSVWTGLIVGIMGLFLLESVYIKVFSILVLILLSIFLFSPVFPIVLRYLVKRILKREVIVPFLHWKTSITVIPIFLLPWIFWAVGFYFLTLSISNEYTSLKIFFAFPMAASIGIVALVSPGGLGIREGILTGYLTFCGLGLSQATTVAVAARLWFLIGEVFIFATALILKRIQR